MGAYQNNQGTKTTGSGTRGTVRNDSRLEAFGNGGAKGDADWGGCDPNKLQAVMVAITSLGGAITFGLSRDQGAHSLTLLLDDSKATLWFNGNADLDAELDAVYAKLDGLQ